MPGELTHLAELCAGSLGSAALCATTGTLPFQRDFLGKESLHGIRHVGEPGTAAQLAIRKHVQPDGPLLLERRQNRLVFLLTQLIQWYLSRGLRGSGRQ